MDYEVDNDQDDWSTDSQGCGAGGSSRTSREVSDEADEADSNTTAHGEVVR